MWSVSLLSLLGSLAISDLACAQQVVTNHQTQNAAVTATQLLDVVENYEVLDATTAAAGNQATIGNEVNSSLVSNQSVTQNIDASTTVNGKNVSLDPRVSLGTPLYVDTQAVGNYGAITSKGAQSDNQVTQSFTGAHVYADTQINSDNNSIYESGEARAQSYANQTQFGATDGRITGSVTQSSDGISRARTGAVVVYSPSPNLYVANAGNNYVSSNGTGTSSVDLRTIQDTTNTTEAYVSVNGGNMWNVAGAAHASANVVDIGNHGGSIVSENTQNNTGHVLSQTTVTAFDYGTATADAYGVGNSYYAGNNDIYVRLDNTQFNGGTEGVQVSATYEGTNGYDAYVNAEAIGNSATGFACAGCQADMIANNSQTNDAGVSATATTRIAGTGRSIITTARAVGNSATYYTSGKP